MRNNPTWTIDPEYYWSCWEDREQVSNYHNISHESSNTLFKSEPKFKSSFDKPKFTRETKTQIGFNNGLS
jgi:hypothetical protein